MSTTPEEGQPLRTLAVTGTNGKTTTTSMLAAIVAATGEPTALVTTLGMWVNGELVAAEKSIEAFKETLARASAAHVRTLALEVTSRALAAGFARRHPPDVAVFTNLSHDHLDRHGSAEAYLAAKAQLFLALREGGTAVLNAADPVSALLAEILPAGVRTLRYDATASDGSCDLSARNIRQVGGALEIDLHPSPVASALGGCLWLSVPGDFNADNALAAALAAWAAGYPPDAIRAGLERFQGVPGRFQIVADAPLVVVDFAHSPDALSRVLDSARRLASWRGGKLRCVFGCGGERDRDKRPVMGALAEQRCDHVMVTSDNPRSEDPEAIMQEILGGMKHGQADQLEDRASAITQVVQRAADADVVVIAGRGPETEQERREGPRKLSDASVAEAAAAARKRSV